MGEGHIVDLDVPEAGHATHRRDDERARPGEAYRSRDRRRPVDRGGSVARDPPSPTPPRQCHRRCLEEERRVGRPLAHGQCSSPGAAAATVTVTDAARAVTGIASTAPP